MAGRPIFSYCRGHETLRKHKSSQSPYGLDYNIALAYAWEVKTPRGEHKKRSERQIEKKDRKRQRRRKTSKEIQRGRATEEQKYIQ